MAASHIGHLPATEGSRKHIRLVRQLAFIVYDGCAGGSAGIYITVLIAGHF